MTLTLGDPGLRKTHDGYEYVLSHALDTIEHRSMIGNLKLWTDPEIVTFYPGSQAVAVKGLTGANREHVEETLQAALIDVNRAHRAAETMATGGKEWNSELADRDEAEVRRSFDALPATLP